MRAVWMSDSQFEYAVSPCDDSAVRDEQRAASLLWVTDAREHNPEDDGV